MGSMVLNVHSYRSEKHGPLPLAGTAEGRALAAGAPLGFPYGMAPMGGPMPPLPVPLPPLQAEPR